MGSDNDGSENIDNYVIILISDIEDSGKRYIININSIPPIIKSRDTDFIVGSFFSKVYVLILPKPAISEPPKTTPRTC